MPRPVFLIVDLRNFSDLWWGRKNSSESDQLTGHFQSFTGHFQSFFFFFLLISTEKIVDLVS